MKRHQPMKPRPLYGGVTGPLARVFDAAVAVVAPTLALRMRASRYRNAELLAYEATRFSPQNPKEKTSGSADADILPDLQELRDRARALVRDDPHASSAADVLADNIVGEDGMRPLANSNYEECGITEEECDAWNKACMQSWKRWVDIADATNQDDFYGLQDTAVRSLFQDGEQFMHAAVVGNDLKCELIDSDRVASPMRVDDEKYRAGVEVDQNGAPVAYHILKRHPNDVAFAGTGWSQKPDRIPARQGMVSMVQHIFRRTRSGQSRGVPMLAASLGYKKHLHHYMNSELIAARMDANNALWIKRALSTTDADLDPLLRDVEHEGDRRFFETWDAGQVNYLNEGEEPVAFKSNRPGTQFDPFVVRVLRACAASWGLCYELVARDLGPLSYSAARSLLVEVRRTFSKGRNLLARKCCQPWYENVILWDVAQGRLTPPKEFLSNPKPFMRARWIAPPYGWVDPATEIEASAEAVRANLSTPYDEARRSGLDAEQILEERARFTRRAIDLEKEWDIPPGSLTGIEPPAPAVRSADTGSSTGAKEGDPAQPKDGND